MRRRAFRVGISIFLLFHVASVVAWNLPESALKQKLGALPALYLLPTGQWQHWGMFAPEPLRETLALEVQARDARGVLHAYRFPRMADKSVTEAFLGYRHSKFTHNMAPETAVGYREFAARHAVRSWNLPETAFPVELDLYYQVWRPTAIGEPAAEADATPQIQYLQSYRFPTSKDVEP